MGKLRMKETPQDRLSARDSDNGSGSSSSHRKKKRRKREYSAGKDDIDESARDVKGKGRSRSRSPDVDSDSYVPPRPRADRPYVPYSYNDDDEESRLPPPRSSAYKNVDDAEFTAKLFNAMREDEGYEPYSRASGDAGYSYDYREALPDARAYGPSGVASDRYTDPDTGFILNRVIFKDAMTDDDYAEHVRRGMFRRTRKEELAAQEAYEAAKRAKEKKRADLLAAQRAAEAERLQKLEDRARRKAAEGSVKSREAYQAAWARLVDPKRGHEQLKMDDFPWPIGKDSDGQLDAKSVQDFLLAHIEEKNTDEARKKKKAALRTAVLAYHPDRFERYVLRVQEEQERASVREMGLRVSQILNQLLNDMS